jgi:Xaa-Pro aminopeptidase
MMGEALLLFGDSATNDDLFHATRFYTHDPLIYLETADTKIIVTYGSDVERAQKTSIADQVWDENDLGFLSSAERLGSKHKAYAAVAMEACRRLSVDQLVVPDWYPATHLAYLRRHGIRIRIEPDVLGERRRQKSADEVDAIRTALRVAEGSLYVVRALLAAADVGADRELTLQGEPLTSERLHREARAYWSAHDCEGEIPYIAGGAQSAYVNEPGFGVLKAGEPILCDLWPRHSVHRYYADITRTFCVGEAPDELVLAHQAVKDALECAREGCVPGACGRDVYAAVCDLLHEHGYATLLHDDAESFGHDRLWCQTFLGHGVGLSVHEEDVGPQPHLRSPMQPGDVMTIEPTLFKWGWGSIRLEDMLVMTPEGNETLTVASYELEVH